MNPEFVARGPGRVRVAVWGVGVTGAVAAAMGGFWLAAWLSGAAAARSAAGQVLVMKTNLAAGLLLAGAALALLGTEARSRPRRDVGAVAAFLVLLLGALTLAEHVFRVDLGIDQLLATEAPGALGAASPNRMGVPASSSLVLLGAGLLALAWRRRFVPWFGVAVCFINLVPLAGYLYHIAEFYSEPRLTAIAWPSTVALMCLGTGLALASSEAGPLALLRREDAGGRLFRQWLPVVTLVPLALGFLRLRGERWGLYGPAEGTGIFILALVVLFTALLWFGAARLSQSAQAHAAAEAEVGRQREGLRSAALFPEENPAPVLRAGRDGTVLFANRAAAALLVEWQCGAGERAPAPVREAVSRALESGLAQELETSLGPRQLSFNLVPIIERDYVNFYGLDITERKQVERRLHASLHEKEVLLKEIHHRVKNNLQVISSLVSLQADALGEPALRGVFEDVRDRVRSMALVHEKLYQSESLAGVDFAGYTRSLMNYLWRAHADSAAGIRLNLDLQPLSLPVDTAVPCGLILNELVANTLKHAFQGRSKGEVTIALHARPDGRVHLRVADNGVGLPPGLDWQRTRSMGLSLVQMLAGQLNATVEAGLGGGTQFEIAFLRPEPQK